MVHTYVLYIILQWANPFPKAFLSKLPCLKRWFLFMLSQVWNMTGNPSRLPKTISAAAETMLLAIPVIFLSPWSLQLKGVKDIEGPMKVETELFLIITHYSGFQVIKDHAKPIQNLLFQVLHPTRQGFRTKLRLFAMPLGEVRTTFMKPLSNDRKRQGFLVGNEWSN